MNIKRYVLNQVLELKKKNLLISNVEIPIKQPANARL